jgi:hypothetical protein
MLVMKKLLVLFMVFLSLSLFACSTPKVSDNGGNLFKDGLLAAQKDGLWGYINKENDVVIDFEYQWVSNFYDGEAIVLKNEVFDLIDTSGKSVLAKTYVDLIRDWNTGTIKFKENNLYGLMDNDGKIIMEATYASIGDFYEDRAVVKKDNKFGYIDIDGKLVVDCEYKLAMRYSQGLAQVSTDGVTFGYIGLDGDLVFDEIYTYSSRFSDYGQAIVSSASDLENGLYQLIDDKGTVLLEHSGRIYGFGPIYYLVDGGFYYLYDTTGLKFIETGFEKVLSTDGYSVRISNSDQSITDILYSEDKQEVARVTYPEGRSIVLYIDSEETVGLVQYGENEITVYFNNQQFTIPGERIMPWIDNGKVIVIKDELMGISKLDGTMELDYQYDFIYYQKDGYYLVSLDDSWGVIDEDYGIIIPLEYQRLNSQLNIPII